MIISAKEELGKIEHLLRGTLEEIAYLESEKQAVESFVKFHELQSERREVFKKVFSSDWDYGIALNTASEIVAEAEARLGELNSRLNDFSSRKEKLLRKREFVEADILLLTNMKQSSPRAKIIEYAVWEFV
ncbi:hypothetical protein B6D51_24075 [Pseudomonas chlororaphis subsp. chlororaphis]|nr:hypothetical protein B6D51_24075 [Pseudomonas chlororaphis subsp. chlororaphis]